MAITVERRGPRGGTFLRRLPRRRAAVSKSSSVSPTRRKESVLPLKVCLDKRNGKSVALSRQGSRNDLNFSSTRTQCNIYVGENFSVCLQQYFSFVKLMGDNSAGGMIHNNFYPHKKLKEMTLSIAAIRLATVPNAGGNSVVSEVLSFELFRRCFNAKLLKTEMEVDYFPMGGSITDYVCDIFGHKVGVSVTRAMKYHGEYTDEDANRLLTKKLKGVVQSTKNSMEKWEKQILHVWTTSKDTANTLTRVYHTLETDITSNTVVMVTVSTNAKYIFKNS
ncbi:AAC-rich mRNA clone AAC4 protein-like [Ylistrum balloti]|uniref:AAC-rich mRNA clone AAC4 protein-like n=1 Tax=Ylistrum balloti TaxID=509963 RepID=UPI002905DC0F|nr:AAC-rich mRNA clone AAC4 protein-like [Ylistrum balloti]